MGPYAIPAFPRPARALGPAFAGSSDRQSGLALGTENLSSTWLVLQTIAHTQVNRLQRPGPRTFALSLTSRAPSFRAFNQVLALLLTPALPCAS